MLFKNKYKNYHSNTNIIGYIINMTTILMTVLLESLM